jgi:hypothetical protein
MALDLLVGLMITCGWTYGFFRGLENWELKTGEKAPGAFYLINETLDAGGKCTSL